MKIAKAFVLSLLLTLPTVFATYACTQCGGIPPECMFCVTQQVYGKLHCYDGACACYTSGDCYVAGCFLAGTLVTTPNGAIAIEQLSVGDEVVSLTAGGEMGVGIVSKTYRTVSHAFYRINGSMEVTGPHPFLVGNAWVNAEDLQVGDVINGEAGGGIPVVSVEKVDFGVRAFNIEVDGSHTFFVDGMIVHNKYPQPN